MICLQTGRVIVPSTRSIVILFNKIGDDQFHSSCYFSEAVENISTDTYSFFPAMPRWIAPAYRMSLSA